LGLAQRENLVEAESVAAEKMAPAPVTANDPRP
jgi:hypothetical protein